MGPKRKLSIILEVPNSSAEAPSRPATPAEYPRLLAQLDGVRRVDGCFVLRDYVRTDSTYRGVSDTDWVHIYAASLPFKCGSAAPLLVCDCPDMSRGATALLQRDARAHTRADFQNAAQPCLHIRALHALYPNGVPTDSPSAPPANSLSALKFDADPVMLTVAGKTAVSHGTDPSIFGRRIITVDVHNHFKCGSCKHGAHSCIHVGSLQEWLDEHPEETRFAKYSSKETGFRAPPAPIVPQYTAVSVSKLPLNYMAPQRIRRATPGRSASWLFAGSAACTPPAGTCACGHELGEPVIMERGAKLFGRDSVLDVDVYLRPCPGCAQQTYYDGYDEGVFNYSNKTLFLHEVLYDYLHSFKNSALPFVAYHRIMHDRYTVAGYQLCSVSTLTKALESFIDMVDTGTAGFCCEICDALPEEQRIVICDVKCDGSMWKLLGSAEPRVEEGVAPEINAMVYALIPAAKRFAKHRGLLRAYARGKPVEGFGGTVKFFQENLPPLGDALKELVSAPGALITCPPNCTQFIADICTDYPLSGLIMREAVFPAEHGADPPLTRICHADSISVADIQFLQSTFPSMATMVAGWPRVPTQFHALFAELARLARLPGECTDTASLQQRNDLPQNARFEHYPRTPRIRAVRVYPGAVMSYESCTKHSEQHHTFSPGIFTAHCPHRTCIGFHLMEKFEGPSSVFEVLFTRFASCPGYIIYDNACNLMRYCLKREPLFFAKARFLIDRLHYKCHRTCHSGFNMNSYPPETPVLGGRMALRDVNSQVCEQTNSQLNLISTQTKYMRGATFFAYVRLFLAMKCAV